MSSIDNKAEQMQLKKEKMILELQKEINNLEEAIQHLKITNLKNSFLRKINIDLKTGQLIAPYLLVAGLTFEFFSSMGLTPFYRDNQKQNLQLLKELDNLGNIRIEQQYENYENASSVICYYDKWNLDKDNLYSREIKTYQIGNISEERIEKILNNEATNLEDIFGPSISIKKETKNNLTKEEIESGPILEARIYSEDKHDFIMVKESVNQNLLSIVLWILFSVMAGILPMKWREYVSKFDYHRSIKIIEEKYPNIDFEFLTKQLEIRKDNYERLTRK